MSREETIQILMTIQAAYPNYKPPDKTITVNFWHRMLENYTYQQVEAAVDAYIRTDKSGFAPSVGTVIDKMQMIFGLSDEINEMTAWNIVWKAVRSSGDYERAQKNFEKLPPTIQKTIGNPGQLMEWALTQDINVAVVSSNFMRTFRTEAAREKELRKLSPELLNLINQGNVQKKIKEKENIRSLPTTEEDQMKSGNPMPETAKRRFKELFGKDVDEICE